MVLAAKPNLEGGTRLRRGYRRVGRFGVIGGVITLGTGGGACCITTLGVEREGIAGGRDTLGVVVAGKGYKPGDLGVGGSRGRRMDNGVGGGGGKGGMGSIRGGVDIDPVLAPRTRAGVISTVGENGEGCWGGGGWEITGGVVFVGVVVRFKILAISTKASVVVDPNCSEG